jgi:hypothetical protein
VGARSNYLFVMNIIYIWLYFLLSCPLPLFFLGVLGVLAVQFFDSFWPRDKFVGIIDSGESFRSFPSTSWIFKRGIGCWVVEPFSGLHHWP